MEKKAIFIAATGQNVGKTTVCLGLLAHFQKKIKRLGFIKPVGQEHVAISKRLLVDKDVMLFKERFGLKDEYQDMSPVIVPKGYTRDYLDGKSNLDKLKKQIDLSFNKIYTNNDFTIVEGTGHVGVGSIIELNNAVVAKALGLDMVIIAKGGIGSAFDELALNKALCDQMGVKIRGVILNKVIKEKESMVVNYIEKALKRWQIPLIGTISFSRLLSTPTMSDFANLFKTELITGQEYESFHFEKIRLVATSLETFLEITYPNELIVTPATREDIVLGLIHKKMSRHGLILTGRKPPTTFLKNELKSANLPSLYAPYSSFEAMRLITSYTAKIRTDDPQKINRAIDLVEKSLNFDLIN